MRALYVSPMPYGANAAVDAICHGLESTLAAAGAEMRVSYADFADPGWRELAVVGGPDVIDDIELLAGIRHGLNATGLVTVNDPEDPRYKNTTDVASGGQEKTANLLADFPSLDGLVPFNDETMLCAVQGLRDA